MGGDLEHFAERESMGLTFMEKHLPGGVNLPGGFQCSSAVQTLCWVLFLFLPVLQSPWGRIRQSVGLVVGALAIQY